MTADIPRVQSEEEVYRYEPANNGAGPGWCTGSTCLVRVGEDVFASGLETIPNAKPLNNCRWMLFRRTERGWELVHKDEHGRTREPSPLLALPDGRVFLFANPSLTEPDAYSGPAQPQLLEFSACDPTAPPKVLLPEWSESVIFTEHSYRNLAADAQSREVILFQNRDYDRAYWSFRDRDGRWSAQGKLVWPWGADYEAPQPIRLCYCNYLLRNRAVYVWGTSDIEEPVSVWREFKFKLTGKKWDYDFRRLFFSWTPDITREPFHPWIEIASREKTAGNAQNCDLWVSADGLVHLLWKERAIDERLREKFFPNERQKHSLNYAALRDGKIITCRVLAQGGEGISDEQPSWGRFHVAKNGRLFVIFTVGGKDTGGNKLTENRLLEIRADGTVGPAMKVPLKHPFIGQFFTASPRAGSPPSNTLELLGECHGEPQRIRYARIKLAEETGTAG